MTTHAPDDGPAADTRLTTEAGTSRPREGGWPLHARRSLPLADALTYLAACLATGVAAQGMWRFFGDVLAFPPELRIGMFAFMEVAVLASAVRARRALREEGRAGVDAAAVWVLTSLSAALSAMDSHSTPEAVFRLAAPLVAAWLWERGMATDRRRSTNIRRIFWRITPALLLVRLGLAEPNPRGAGDAMTARRLTTLALAAKRARSLQSGDGRRRRRALARLERALERAVTDTDLASNPQAQRELLAQLATLTSAPARLTAALRAPWPLPDAAVDEAAESPRPDPIRPRVDDPRSDPIPRWRTIRSAPASTARSPIHRSDPGTIRSPIARPIRSTPSTATTRPSRRSSTPRSTPIRSTTRAPTTRSPRRRRLGRPPDRVTSSAPRPPSPPDSSRPSRPLPPCEPTSRSVPRTPAPCATTSGPTHQRHRR